MDPNSLHRKQLSADSRAVGRSSAGGPIGKKVHAAHRTERVRIRGLIMDLPGTDGAVEVCVNHQADWELIYKNPTVHVKCLVPSCDTLLTAKRMSHSGLRFLAVRSGGCSHNLVEMRVEHDEVAQDPSKLVGGGGPEGVEHLWIKVRLYRLAQSIGARAVVEHSLTHADVFLPEHNLVLEYQRWNTNFAARTAQRTSAGAARTIWMFPSQLPKAAPSALRKRFDKEVFQNGGIYVSVLNPSGNYEAQMPWKDPSQEHTALLFASGSIAEFDPKRQVLVRTRRSLATVLKQIIRGERTLEQTVVWKKSQHRQESARVWVRREDLALAEAAQAKRQLASPPVASLRPATEPAAEPQTDQEAPPEHEPAAEMDDPQMRADAPTPAVPAGHSPGLLEPANAEDHPIAAPGAVSAVDNAISTTQQVRTQQPAPRSSWWRKIGNWFRQM